MCAEPFLQIRGSNFIRFFTQTPQKLVLTCIFAFMGNGDAMIFQILELLGDGGASRRQGRSHA